MTSDELHVEVHVELLLGCRVRDARGRSVGRIEELHAVPSGSDYVVDEFHVGAEAAAERLSARPIVRTLMQLFGLRARRPMYRVPWDKLDLSKPTHPRLTCRREELEEA